MPRTFGVFIVASSMLSLVAPANVFGPRLLQQNDSEIVPLFSSLDYVCIEKGSPVARDGWLIKDNLIHLPESGKGYNHITVRGRRGGVIGAGDYSLWFVNPKNSNFIVSDIFNINDNHFEHTFDLERGARTVRLISSKYVRPSDIDPKSRDSRLLSVIIDGMDLSGGRVKLIIPSEIKREVVDGYTRKFTFSSKFASE